MSARTAVDELVRLFDHVLDDSEFGYDHWHSLLWNLHNVRDEDWDARPPTGERTIRELAEHIGDGYLAYGSSAFGDGSYQWGNHEIDGVVPGSSAAEIARWLRRAHLELRTHISSLTDDDLTTPRKAPWGALLPTRRLIEIQIQHTTYHTGEINHIRALLQGNDAWNNDDIGRE